MASILKQEETKQYILDVLAEWSIPTAAIALVDLENDKSETGFFKLQGIDETIGDTTSWSICSNTKLFTVVALGILVDEGKLSWKDKLCDLVPGLRLKDEYASSMLTLEDALSHQSGIPAYNEAWLPNDGKHEDIVEILNELEPTYRPLRKFQYCNGMYSLAGHIIALKSGQTYTDFVTHRILIPLGMTSSSFGHAAEGTKLATPYIAEKGSPAQKFGFGFHIARDDWIAAAVAGLNCTAGDLGTWMQYLLRLASGRLEAGDAAMIRPETFKEIMRSRCLYEDTLLIFPSSPGESAFPEISLATYALGLWRCHYRGFDVMYHGGAGVGAGSIVLLLPKKQLGIAIMTPVASADWYAIPAVAFKLLDQVLGLPEINWRKRVNESSSGNKIVFEPPHAHEPGVDPHLHNTVYENAAFGRLHVLAPDTGVASLPDSVGEVIGQMTQARQYGSAYSGKKDLVAIFEAKQNHLSYYALYRTGPGKYWAQHHCIKRAEAQDDGELIDATRTVMFLNDTCQAQLEFGEDRLLLKYAFVDDSCDFQEPTPFRKVK